MKAKYLLIVFIASLFMGLFSCCTTTRMERTKTYYHKEKRIPPGQAKKNSNSKSAKHFAPGHNKH